MNPELVMSSLLIWGPPGFLVVSGDSNSSSHTCTALLPLSHLPSPCWAFLFETGCYYTAQVCLELCSKGCAYSSWPSCLRVLVRGYRCGPAQLAGSQVWTSTASVALSVSRQGLAHSSGRPLECWGNRNVHPA